MKARFYQLQSEIGCRNLWLAEMLEVTPEHVSRLRNGHAEMTRQTELCMMALASGWRP